MFSSRAMNDIVNNSYSQCVDNLLKSCSANVWIHPDIKAYQIEGKGSAFVSTREITDCRNKTLLRVKPSCLLNSTTVKYHKTVQWTAHQLLAHFMAALVETNIKSTQNNGIFHIDAVLADITIRKLPEGYELSSGLTVQMLSDYIQTLPKTYDNMPMTWKDSLIPPDMETAIKKQRYQLLEDYFVTHQLEKQQDRDDFFVNLEKTNSIDRISWECFKWAWLTVNTRCLYITISSDTSLNLTLAPVIDLLNHTDVDGLNIEDVITEAKEKGVDRSSVGNPSCEMRWNRIKGMEIYTTPGFTYSYSKGEEIYLTYGHHSNLKLLQEYGFVLESNCHDFVDISTTLFPETFSARQNKLSNEPGMDISKAEAESRVIKKLNDLGYTLGNFTVMKSQDSYLSYNVIVACVAIYHSIVSPDKSSQNEFRKVDLLANGYISEDDVDVEINTVVASAVQARRHQIEQYRKYVLNQLSNSNCNKEYFWQADKNNTNNSNNIFCLQLKKGMGDSDKLKLVLKLYENWLKVLDFVLEKQRLLS